ncbi:DUF2933 domain-containing protein [Roseomonas chloroacetimidivorans]|uniref:DUF2933 domain-containing protein n=1 Tax=Roseomonas chloroacetimidivorans TaxID=1766656 RepID=UPI003C787DC7
MHGLSQLSWWRSKGGITVIGFGLIIAFYVLREHYEHALGALPYLLLLACPLMHLFMHHGHGAHQGPSETASESARESEAPRGAPSSGAQLQ